MKFGSKRAIFGVIWGGFEGFGPCLGDSHPTHPHLGEISQKKTVFFFGSSPNTDRLKKQRIKGALGPLLLPFEAVFMQQLQNIETDRGREAFVPFR